MAIERKEEFDCLEKVFFLVDGTSPLLTQKRKRVTSCGMIDPFVLLYLSRIEYDDAPYLCVPHTFRARNAI